MNDVNCDSVMIISMNLLGLAGCQPLVGYPSPLLNLSGDDVVVLSVGLWVEVALAAL
jgi:hypothetical protein